LAIDLLLRGSCPQNLGDSAVRSLLLGEVPLVKVFAGGCFGNELPDAVRAADGGEAAAESGISGHGTSGFLEAYHGRIGDRICSIRRLGDVGWT
jgi:hypothetical protein